MPMIFDDKTNIHDIENLSNLAKKAGDKTSAFLLVMAGSQVGRLYTIERPSVSVGRGSNADIRIEDDGVSRLHARLEHTEAGIVLRDLGSTNGTLCNGERVFEHPLADGDRIQVGTGTVLKFSYQDTLEEEFQRQQYESLIRDALTGCFNRKYLVERMPAETAFAERHKTPLAIALLDVDHFKQINDNHGHPGGDAVLHALGQLLLKTMRVEDVVARFGGEEFAIVMRGIDITRAVAAAERVRQAISEFPFVYDGADIHVTVSLGVAVWLPSEREPPGYAALLEQADQALYRAKAAGRNRTELARSDARR